MTSDLNLYYRTGEDFHYFITARREKPEFEKRVLLFESILSGCDFAAWLIQLIL